MKTQKRIENLIIPRKHFSFKVIQVVLFFVLFGTSLVSAQEKHRLFVLTDIGGDPDDQMSMVRLLTYANQIDIEGLVADRRGQVVRIEAIIEAYGKVRDNLEFHEPGFPEANKLMACTAQALTTQDLDAATQAEASAGVKLLIDAVDRDDPRPLWVNIWGGPSVLGQTLWRICATRSPKEVAKFVSKLRIYSISDQDPTGPDIRAAFPDLFYIVTPGANAGGGFHHATWIGIGGDKFHGRFDGADFGLVTNEWLERNIRSKGPLGNVYPHWEFMMEGDTPAFLYLVNNGLNNPDQPDWGGLGRPL